MAETLLVELLTEELPPKSLRALSEAFGAALVSGLRKSGLSERDGARLFATPRRLAVLVPDVTASGEDKTMEVTGPSVSAPAQAVAGFAKKHGVGVESLERRAGAKSELYVARVRIAGQRLDAVLAPLVEEALKSLPIPKMMRWGSADTLFVRPVHGLVMLHGERVVPGTVLGLSSSSRTSGHRFMGKGHIALEHADRYEERLEEGMVLASFAKRRAAIEEQLKAEAERRHATLGDHEDLLDEVTALVEYPHVYAGAFDRAFLEIPVECLILTLRKNQKYFPLFDTRDRLLPAFLIVSNMKVADPRHIIAGNERVVRPRLEDARFFYDQAIRSRIVMVRPESFQTPVNTSASRIARSAWRASAKRLSTAR
ncbi:MAG TPA: glycine--tRNA ligase subunit beta, partial [Burkholderiales bacterium]|nr:glycine--tRNA ligase subunit beta [Burkholderiales bacterium]